jgi:tRNA A-37 threonylcarbamoyl transferase component Bud32
MTRQSTITVDGLRWFVLPEAQSILGPDELRLPNHVDSGRATTVKHGEHRTVYRVQLADSKVYWKHCRLNGPRAYFRDLFRGPKAKLEFDRLTELKARGIATVEPLAWARFDKRWPRGSFLITRELEGTMPLDEYLALHPPRSPKDRRNLAVRLAQYANMLHTAGVQHPDFHPGNLLVRDCGNGLEFFLIDVHDIELGDPLGKSARRRNLILFSRWFRLRVERTDRLRFWRAYSGPEADREEARDLERLSDRSIIDLFRSRDGRCLRKNRHFRRISGSRTSGFAVRELDAAFESELIANPDKPFEDSSRLIKNSRSSTVCTLEIPTAAGTKAMIYKRFRLAHWYDSVSNLVRSSPARRSWMNGHAFLDRALPTPRPWLFLHRKRRGVPAEGYLLCERVEGYQHLQEAIDDADLMRRREIGERVARMVRTMHERGVSHRDLKAANILVGPTGDLQFIDLVGVRLGRSVSRSVRVRDIMRLSVSFLDSKRVSRTDRLRFLRMYLAWSLRGKGDWKRWWAEVDQATRAKVRRNQARNRPLS